MALFPVTHSLSVLYVLQHSFQLLYSCSVHDSFSVPLPFSTSTSIILIFHCLFIFSCSIIFWYINPERRTGPWEQNDFFFKKKINRFFPYINNEKKLITIRSNHSFGFARSSQCVLVTLFCENLCGNCLNLLSISDLIQCWSYVQCPHCPVLIVRILI